MPRHFSIILESLIFKVSNDCTVIFNVGHANRINIGADVLNYGFILGRMFKGFVKDCIGVLYFVSDHVDWGYVSK